MLLPGFISLARRLGYEPRWVVMIFSLQLCAVLFEGVGVSMVLPILEFLRAGGDTAVLATDSRMWRWMVDAAVTIGVPLNLITLMSGAFIAILIRQAFMFARDLATGWVQFELTRRLRNQCFHDFIHADLGYHDRVSVGEFVNELTTELLNGVGTMTAAADFLGTIVLVCVYVAIVFLLSPSLTIMAVLVLLAVSILLIRMMRGNRFLGEQVTQANQKMSGFLVERLKAIRLVRLSGVEALEEAALGKHTLEQRDRLHARNKVLALLGVLIEPIVLVVAFVLLYVAVNTLHMQMETILVFFFILLRLIPIVKTAILQRQGYIANLASIEIIDRRLKELVSRRDPSGGARIFEKLAQGITFKNVTFHYEGSADGTAALENVTLKIPVAKMTALVGPSGSGKSTLVDLLPRLRTPQSGQILYDNVPQGEFNIASLRSAVSFAPQQPQIFNVTMAEHISLSKPDASMDEIVSAARLAQADDFIRALPEGYETLLGEGGSRLSGGQCQRLDLARALVRRAPILVLDEPTANLDAEAEAKFRSVLRAIQSETDITIVIIGHRLSTVRAADQIVVLQDGRIGQIGTHDVLMRKGGWYASAFESQHSDNPTAPFVTT